MVSKQLYPSNNNPKPICGKFMLFKTIRARSLVFCLQMSARRPPYQVLLERLVKRRLHRPALRMHAILRVGLFSRKELQPVQNQPVRTHMQVRRRLASKFENTHPNDLCYWDHGQWRRNLRWRVRYRLAGRCGPSHVQPTPQLAVHTSLEYALILTP